MGCSFPWRCMKVELLRGRILCDLWLTPKERIALFFSQQGTNLLPSVWRGVGVSLLVTKKRAECQRSQ
jgi:hypothetical protein